MLIKPCDDILNNNLHILVIIVLLNIYIFGSLTCLFGCFSFFRGQCSESLVPLVHLVHLCSSG